MISKSSQGHTKKGRKKRKIAKKLPRYYRYNGLVVDVVTRTITKEKRSEGA